MKTGMREYLKLYLNGKWEEPTGSRTFLRRLQPDPGNRHGDGQGVPLCRGGNGPETVPHDA